MLPHKQKTNAVALSPQANYTDWSTATYRQCQFLWIEGCRVVSAADPLLYNNKYLICKISDCHGSDYEDVFWDMTPCGSIFIAKNERTRKSVGSN
jgi:hypothetical protein